MFLYIMFVHALQNIYVFILQNKQKKFSGETNSFLLLTLLNLIETNENLCQKSKSLSQERYIMTLSNTGQSFLIEPLYGYCPLVLHCHISISTQLRPVPS